MINYEVYWKDQCIGSLAVEGDWHKYVPNVEIIEKLKGTAFIVAEAMNEHEGKPIQFFKQMIENCSRFEGRSLSYHNNNYCLKKV